MDAVLASLDSNDQVDIHPGWMQGRAAFGGLVTALGLRRVRSVLPDERPLRSVHTFFSGPVETGPVTVKARVIRSGRSSTSAEARLIQGDEERALIRTIHGASRPSVLAVRGPEAPEVVPPEQLQSLPFVEGLTPAFVERFDMRWASGDLPFAGSSQRTFAGWCRLREGAVRGAEAIAALVDAWPNPFLPMLSTFAPASSVTWTLDLFGPVEDVEASDWWLYASRADEAAEGYGFMTAHLWSARGHLVARGTQMVAIFG